jgi:hypothetical protein
MINSAEGMTNQIAPVTANVSIRVLPLYDKY